MHVEGIAFYTAHGRPGYLTVTFTDEGPGAAYGVPVAVLRGERVAGGHQALARAVIAGRSAEWEATVGVYVGPYTTDLEITFLWIARFRARKVRACEAVAARGRWQIAAWRHYAQAAGLARRSLRVEGGLGHVTGRGPGLRTARRMGVAAATVLAAGRILGIGVRTPLSVVSGADRASLEGYFNDFVKPAVEAPVAQLARLFPFENDVGDDEED